MTGTVSGTVTVPDDGTGRAIEVHGETSASAHGVDGDPGDPGDGLYGPVAGLRR